MLWPVIAAVVVLWLIGLVHKASTNDKEQSNGKRK